MSRAPVLDTPKGSKGRVACAGKKSSSVCNRAATTRQTEKGAQGVGRQTTSTVVSGIFLITAADAVFKSFSVHAGEIVTILGSSGRLKPAKRNDRSAAADGGNHSNPGRGNIRPRGPWQWTSGNGPSAFSSNPAPCSVLLTRRMRRIEDSPT